MAEQLTMFITVGNLAESDDDFLGDQAKDLAKELRELDAVTSAEPPRPGPAAEHAKGSPMDFSTLAVNLAGASGVTALVTTLGSWMSRDKSRTLKLKLGDQSLELTGLSAAEQQNLIRWFKTQASKQLAK